MVAKQMTTYFIFPFLILSLMSKSDVEIFARELQPQGLSHCHQNIKDEIAKSSSIDYFGTFLY